LSADIVAYVILTAISSPLVTSRCLPSDDTCA
jgi:hypothetical protein